ncbi:MAG: PrsW family glutamic-type intramembrane protease [Eubacteriales bacterium]|nr:PrsW family glutamic-type intramembrane protease [Eubacteriales bacterium]
MQLPTIAVIIVYLLAALLPALLLMRYIYRKDKIEKEPKGMLVGLVFLGVAAAIVAVILETLGSTVLSRFLEEGDPAHTIVMAFLIVAVAEEGAKFVFFTVAHLAGPEF